MIITKKSLLNIGTNKKKNKKKNKRINLKQIHDSVKLFGIRLS